MSQRNLITSQSTENSGKDVGKPFDKILFSSWFHFMNILS